MCFHLFFFYIFPEFYFCYLILNLLLYSLPLFPLPSSSPFKSSSPNFLGEKKEDGKDKKMAKKSIPLRIYLFPWESNPLRIFLFPRESNPLGLFFIPMGIKSQGI